MPESSELYFATRNENKFNEAKGILPDARLRMASIELAEIQSDDLETIAIEKAREACRKLNARVIVEDDALFIGALKGFPGPYSSFVYGTIGNEGIIDLLKSNDDRIATFRSVIAYCKPKGGVLPFVANVRGQISKEIRGKGWGYDPIFIPDGSQSLTYAELGRKKNELSHRKLALEKFALWMKNYKL